jgi:glycosyltransferase involved in cell wall biosynthesis
MNKPILYIFTSSYPYSVGKEDTFLKPELKVLCKIFEIKIFPLNKAGYRHEMPNDVILIDDFAVKNKISIKNLLFKGLKIMSSRFLWSEIIKNYKKLNKIKAVKYLVINALQRQLLLDWMSNNKEKDFNTSDFILYSYWFDGYTSALLDYKKSVKNNIKVVTRAHRGDLYVEETRSGYIPFRENALTEIDSVYLISKHGYDYLANKQPDFVDKYVLSPLGIDDKNIAVKKSTDGVFRIVSCSFVSAVKRVDLIYMSILELSKISNKPIEWFHIGGGPGSDDIQNLIQKNRQSNLKVNLLGNVVNNEIYEFYGRQELDIFLMLSASEGKPVAMMEAMSVGLPVVTTAVGGIPELIENGVNGTLLDVDASAEDVAQAILTIMNDIKRLDFMKIAARKKWLENCNSEICFNHFASKLINNF